MGEHSAVELSPEQTAELRAKLGLKSDQTLDMSRAVQLLGHLVEKMDGLDSVVYGIARVLSPNGLRWRRPSVLLEKMAQFVSGDPGDPEDPEPPLAQVLKDLKKLSDLIAVLATVLPQTPQFAVQHFRVFSPEGIETDVGSSLYCSEKKWWAEYCRRHGSMDTQAMQNAMRQEIAEYIEAFGQGGA